MKGHIPHYTVEETAVGKTPFRVGVSVDLLPLIYPVFCTSSKFSELEKKNNVFVYSNIP